MRRVFLILLLAAGAGAMIAQTACLDPEAPPPVRPFDGNPDPPDPPPPSSPKPQ